MKLIKKTKSILILTAMLSIVVINTIKALPIIGLLGQGSPYWSNGILKCDPGYKWCRTLYFSTYKGIGDLKRADLIALDVDTKGDITITGSSQIITKTFPKLFVNNELVLTDNVILDDKLTEHLGKQLKKKMNGNLALLKGKYKVTNQNGMITISNIKCDYVGHVTLLK